MTDDEILHHFRFHQRIKDKVGTLNTSSRQFFYRLIRAIHNTGLDLYCNRNERSIRFGRKDERDQDAISVAGSISVKKRELYIESRDAWIGTEIVSIPKEGIHLDEGQVESIENELKDWNANLEQLNRSRSGLFPDEYQDSEFEDITSVSGRENKSQSTETVRPHSLNTILYGPPGTGKTYATFRRCVEICDNTELIEEDIGPRYRKLLEEGRVAFVTFHQSYGYEEFVEGLRPAAGSTDSDGSSGAGFRLDPKDGVLKLISKRARKVSSSPATYSDLQQRGIFKMGLGNPIQGRDQGIFEECIENKYILLDFASDTDWTDIRFETAREILRFWNQEYPDARGNDPNVMFINAFRNRLSIGDIVIVPAPQQRFRAIGRVTGEYQYSKRGTGTYPHRRDVEWLWTDSEGKPVSELYDTQIGPATIYRLRPERLQMERLLDYVTQTKSAEDLQPYVLVIDEINRGNISKVFGEAITLVEEDKRAGEPNEVSLTLPYSNEVFSLPPNLYILGTMNTADRSIALLDTALRRRFEFEELAPKPELLSKAAEASGIDLPAVLTAINNRLEWLLDRDHLIGHAWFMAAENRNAVDRIMRRKIIPMLSEYFHEDWSKVRAVLGGGNGFVKRVELDVPPEVDEPEIGEKRYRWTVRDTFLEDTYDRLIGGKAGQADAEVANSEDHSG